MQLKFSQIRVWFAMSTLALLAACGGGGGGGTNASAEGFWGGTSSTGYNVQMVILENGETWGLYTSGSTLYGALYGNTTTTGNAVSGSGSDFNLLSRTVSPGTYSGSVSEKSTIYLAAGSSSFNGTYGSTYDQPASLSAAAGVYTGEALTGSTAAQSITATLSANGALSIPATLGCAVSGTATPRATGKNIFNLSVTFNGSNCALGNGGTATGILYYDSVHRQILAMGMNPGKSDGFIAFGTKP